MTILAVVTSGDAYSRGELSRSNAQDQDEGGFAEVLVGQQESFEVDSENDKIPPAKQKPKQTDKVDPVERNRINAEGSEDADVEIEGDNLFQEVPFQKASTEEISFDEKAFRVVESEGKEAENLDRQSGFSDLLVKNDDLLVEVEGRDDGAQVSFIGDSVAGENSGVEGAAVTDNFILENSDPVKVDETLTLINPGANKNDIGSLAGKVDTLMQKSVGSTIPSDEAGSISLAEDGGFGFQSVESVKSEANNDLEENFVQVDNEPIALKDNQESVIVTAASADLKVEGEAPRQVKDGHESLFDIPPSKENISQNGRVAAEISEDVQIHINNESAVAKAKSENSIVRPGQRARAAALTGDETGVVHLQGRARENQSTLTSNDQQHLKDFSEFKADAGDGEKFSFSEISKETFADQVTLSSSLESVIKEKHSSDHTVLQFDEMAAVHLEAGKDSLVKNSSNIISTKPLPVSDENLMEQIQSGLARQAKGRQTVTIRLWPESMGKVDVKLVLRDQQMSATFMVEQSDVKDAMLRKIDSLRDGLSLRGIDVKEIDIKVSPARSGDGPSVTVGDQHQDSADVWQQYHQNDFSQSNQGSGRSGSGENGSNDSLLLSDNLAEGIPSIMDSGAVSGSLHITA